MLFLIRKYLVQYRIEKFALSFIMMAAKPFVERLSVQQKQQRRFRGSRLDARSAVFSLNASMYERILV